MPTPQAKRVHMWQLAMGCCLVCGAPMELPGARLDDAAGASRDTPVGDSDDETIEVIFGPRVGRRARVKVNKIKMDEHGVQATDNPVRVCMFTHHLLPLMQVSAAFPKATPNPFRKLTLPA